jgi:hypothetical protein
MPAKDRFEFQDRDAVIIHFVYEVTISDVQLIAEYLNAKYHVVYKRAAKLEAQGYLSRITKQPEKAIWQLGPEAASVLIEHGWAPETIARRRLRANELKPLGITHSLFVSRIHAKLLNEAKNRPEQISLWRQDQGTWDKATWTDEDGSRTLPVRPDAYFVIEHTGRPEGKNRLHYYLEADRSTMASERVAAKIKAYRAYHDDGRFERKLHTKSFHVIVITETRRRAESLTAGLAYLLPTLSLRRAYKFLAFEDLSIDALVPKAAANSLTISTGSVRFPQTLEAEHGTK